MPRIMRNKNIMPGPQLAVGIVKISAQVYSPFKTDNPDLVFMKPPVLSISEGFLILDWGNFTIHFVRNVASRRGH